MASPAPFTIWHKVHGGSFLFVLEQVYLSTALEVVLGTTTTAKYLLK